MDNDIKIQFLGGSDVVGSLSMVLEIDNLKLLFDYGMTPSKPPVIPLPAPPVDNIFLSHSHLDHSGMMPSLCSNTDEKIFATKLTGEIASLLHKDTVKIAKMEGYASPYENLDITKAKNNILSVEPKQKVDLNNDLEVEFISAGHIPGSLMFKINGSNSFLFTGDLNVNDTRLVKGTKPVDCDVLCMEGTYAGREHPKKREDLEKDFLDKIDSVISRGGLVILPAFAVSRSQELALILRNSGYNVWYDGMGRKVSKIYLKYPKYLRSIKDLKAALDRINFVHSDHGRKLALESEVIITSSGMMDGGPVLGYLNKLKNDKKSAVILTGYQVENTNSRLLVEKGKIDFYGVIEDIECEVQYYDFSGHAGHSDLIQFAEKCKPKKIILMHSNDRKSLVEPLKGLSEVYTPCDGEILKL